MCGLNGCPFCGELFDKIQVGWVPIGDGHICLLCGEQFGEMQVSRTQFLT